MADTLPPVIASLLADTKEFSAKMGEAKAEMADVSKSGKSAFSGLAAAGKVAFFALGAAAIGVGVESVKMATTFQSSIASIQSNAGISAAAANKIGDAFLDTAGKTEASANEMASAYAPVAKQLAAAQKSTLSAAQAQTVMLAAADLSDAKLGDLTTTSGALAQTMLAFGISSKGAAVASDILYSTATLTDSGVSQLAQGMARLHMRLGEAAPSLKDTAGLLAVLAQNGVSGTRGLNTVASAFPKLLGGTKAVNTELSNLGVNVYDADGKFVGMDATIARLHDSFASMTQQQQMAAATTLFGASAAATMLQIIQKGPAVYDAQAKAADRVGAAHRAAEAQMKTFDGQIKTLGATAEDYGVRLGRVLIPKLELLMKDTAAVIEWFAKHKQAAIGLAAVIAGVLGVAITAFAVNTLGKLINNAKSAYDALKALLGLNGAPQITESVNEPDLKDDSADAGAAFAKALAEAGKQLIADATEAGDVIRTAIETGADVGRDALETGGDESRNALETGGDTARDALETGGDDSRNAMETGGDVSRDALETGGDVARDAVETGGDLGRDALETGGDTARNALETGGDTGRDALETGADTARDALETGGDTARDAMETGGSTAEKDMETGGDVARDAEETGGEVGGATLGTKSKLAATAFAVIIGTQLAGYVNSELQKIPKVAAAEKNLDTTSRIVNSIPVIGSFTQLGTDIGALTSGGATKKNQGGTSIMTKTSDVVLQGITAAEGQAIQKLVNNGATVASALAAVKAAVAKGASKTDAAAIEKAVNTSLKPKATSADIKPITTAVKPVDKSVKDVTTAVKGVKSSVDKQTTTTNVTTTVNLQVDGKTLATAVSKQQVKKAKQATGNVSGHVAGSTQTGSGIAR